MNYILNTKTKKVEIFWDNQNEYQGLINFLSQFPITEEGKNKTFEHTPSPSPNTITWANNVYSTSTVDTIHSVDYIVNDSLSGCVTLNNGAVSTIKTDSTEEAITTALKAVIQPKEDKPEYWLNASPVELHTGRHSQ